MTQRIYERSGCRSRAEGIFALAETIRDTERRQAEQIGGGVSLRAVGGAIEE